jgi:hypothetical protein
MNSLRFKVGEMAIVAVDIGGNGCQGSIVEILEVGPLEEFNHKGEKKRYNYRTSSPHKGWEVGLCLDIELRKIDPPAEPASISRLEVDQESAL